MSKILVLAEPEVLSKYAEQLPRNYSCPLKLMTGDIERDSEVLRMAVAECNSAWVIYTHSERLQRYIGQASKRIPLINVIRDEEPDAMQDALLKLWKGRETLYDKIKTVRKRAYWALFIVYSFMAIAAVLIGYIHLQQEHIEWGLIILIIVVFTWLFSYPIMVLMCD